ncbi:uncharacterized protein CTRU02_209163 [Colletotrichum truncatum]|uniref:Uncharacterized protein n=1 Tax=Colletotrichum truncatum TaxID=5467 RepID=A0ACC3YZR7_COLTU|nr:uncharacterized protein CTRU02_14530 [Colletotrichum truncatum]KAF6782086.1 hypothetical protein CTRU02_14530 [Colletotrichum truncatum]
MHALIGFSMGERRRFRVFQWVWSYVLISWQIRIIVGIIYSTLATIFISYSLA